MAYDCSQICRITSHIRACGPSSGVAVALEPSRITTLSSPPPASQAKIIVNLLAGHVHLAAASRSNNFNCTCNYCQQQCSCLVCSIASLYCPTQFAYLPVRCLISPRLAYRPSLLVLRAPTLPYPAAALAHSTGRSWHRGKSISHSKKHLQPPPYTQVLYCQKRHLAVAAPSATRSASLILHLHRHTYILATAYDRALVAAASPCFGRA